ncbi:Uncharacterized protein TPAR_02371 [Tolypocladium paradoxum]|uniref:Uncharacterized protein n=1 Tax=Tolypocladium paradoxum TaxID=94208 RepID=A0A2S4L4R8_9HYPO|nr:Uncharacterized protein TPAR_02371 [Tolypocladium paradoxum]
MRHGAHFYETRSLLFSTARAATYLWMFGILLDIGMMIVSILAYTGAQSNDDRAVIRRTYITFPMAGRHVQRTEIALASLGVILNPTLATFTMVHMSRLRRTLSRPDVSNIKCITLFLLLPWHIACLAGWLVCVAFQAAYVPILGTRKLPECVRFGSELSQCGFVSASWIIAMLYCVLHLVLLSTVLAMLFYAIQVAGARDQTISSKGKAEKPSTTSNPPRPPSAVIEGPSKVDASWTTTL